MERKLNLDYSLLQGAHWMYFGIITSFASVFLLGRGYENWLIGTIISLGNIGAVIIQPLIADFADRTKRFSLTSIMKMVCIILVILMLGLFIFREQSIGLSLVYILLIAWTTSIQPLLNTLNFKLQQSGIYINFGVARSIGSLAYSVIVLVLGIAVAKYDIYIIPLVGIIVLASFFVMLFLINKHNLKARQIYEIKEKTRNEQFLKQEKNGEKLKTGETSQGKNNLDKSHRPIENDKKEITLKMFIKQNKYFVLMSLGVIGLFFGNAVLNNFMVQIVSAIGGNSKNMGIVLSLMAILEMPTMIFFYKLRRKFTSQTLIKVGAFGFFVKIFLCFISNSIIMIYLAQLTQVFAFALFLPAMVHFIDEIMKKGEAVKGQALFVNMSTLGSVFASFTGGIILDISGAKMLLLVATALTFVGMITIMAFANKIKKGDLK